MARDEDRFTLQSDDSPARTGHRYGTDEASRLEVEEQEFEPEELEEDEQPQFRRAQRRVPVRRSAVNKKNVGRAKFAIATATIVLVLAAGYLLLSNYALRSWRFRIESADNIETSGLANVTRAQVLDVMGADLGRNIFKIPIEERRKQLEELPWVEQASVMRLLPDHLKVDIKERTPVAFARVGAKIFLIDANGVLMEMPGHNRASYSFPVITGMQDTEPVSTRAARMNIYTRLMKELDSSGANYSKVISEVALSDPEDVKVTVDDPAGAVVVHLGSSNFLDRFKTYMAHVAEWRAQFQKLQSVDLRYSGQIVVNPDAPAAAAGK